MPSSRNQLLDEIIQVYEPRYDQKLSREDAREIRDNLAGIMGLLVRWHREDQMKVTTEGDKAESHAGQPSERSSKMH